MLGVGIEPRPSDRQAEVPTTMPPFFHNSHSNNIIYNHSQYILDSGQPLKVRCWT